MLRVAIGHSADIDQDRAVSEAIEQAKRKLGGAEAKAGILFSASALDHPAVLAEVGRAFPDTPIVGCTTAGEASPALGFQDDSVLLLLFSSTDIRFAAALIPTPSKDPKNAAAAAEDLRRQLGGESPRLCFLFGSSMQGDPERVISALAEGFGKEVPIIGGAAACYPPGEQHPYLFFGRETYEDAAVALALSGPLELTTAIETSWHPIGKTGEITSTDGHRVHCIDDAPALDFYRSTLGADAYLFLGAPMAVLDADGGMKVRSPISFDDEQRSIDVAGGVAEGDRVQLAFATVDDVHRGANALIERTLESFPQGAAPALVFFCSCAVRKMFLALDVSTEFEQLQGKVGQSVPVVGFYAYGEIGPLERGGASKFHNQSIVSVALR